VILVITRETWTISKSLTQYLSNITRKDEIEELQKPAILVTAHKLRKVLMQNYRTYFMAEIILLATQTVNTEHTGT